jgi:hypothetical protein
MRPLLSISDPSRLLSAGAEVLISVVSERVPKIANHRNPVDAASVSRNPKTCSDVHVHSRVEEVHIQGQLVVLGSKTSRKCLDQRGTDALTPSLRQHGDRELGYGL